MQNEARATHFNKFSDRQNFKNELIAGAVLVGKYGLPALKRNNSIPRELVPFNKAKTKNGKINQVAVYGRGKDRRGKLKDIDIGHPHKNPDGKLKFQITDIHVHDYTDNSSHSKYARKPSKKERRLLMIAMYGKRKK